MNAATLPNPSPNMMMLPLPTAADLVKSFPPAFKDALLAELIRDRLASDPDVRWFDVAADAGRRLGLFLKHDPETAAADELYASLPHEHRLAVMKAELEFDWNDCLTDEEVLNPSGRRVG